MCGFLPSALKKKKNEDLFVCFLTSPGLKGYHLTEINFYMPILNLNFHQHSFSEYLGNVFPSSRLRLGKITKKELIFYIPYPFMKHIESGIFPLTCPLLQRSDYIKPH